jgi:cytochrome P450
MTLTASTLVLAPFPPGPKGRFFSGHLPELRRDRLAFVTRCAREYGDFVSLRVGRRQIVLVSDPDAIEYVLVTASRQFAKHFALRLNPLVLGNGLLSSEGDFWLRQRRLAQPAFHRQRIAAYGASMVEHTLRLLAGWQEGQRRDIFTEMMQLTLGIAAKTLFDADVDGQAAAVGDALRVAQDCFIARFNSLFHLPAGFPTPANLRLRRAVRQLDAIIYGFIRHRRQTGEDKGDLLSMLLHARDEGDQSQMTDKQLRDEAMTLFLAGHETTALLLSWAWYLLARHPEAEARLAAEVRAVLGGRPPTVADLPHLPYTETIVAEVLRLYPPAYTIGREALRECRLGPYRIAAGTTLLMSQWVMHRDPRFFDRPEEFHPERWADGLAARLPRYAYFPFGGGPRRCIGDTFATMEAQLVLATLAQQYRFTLATDEAVRPRPTFTLRPDSNLPAVLRRR